MKLIICLSLVFTLNCLAQTKIAVLNFEAKGIPAHEASILSDEFQIALAKRSNFTIIEREQLNRILKEHKLALSGILDDKSIKEIGHISGVDMLVMGSAGKIGNKYYLSVRLVDVKTAVVLIQESNQSENKTSDLMKYGTQKLAQALIWAYGKNIRKD